MIQDDPRHQALHLLLAIAWADGEIAPTERAMLAELIARAPGAADNETLTSWLDSAPPAPDWDAIAAGEAAHELLVNALRLSMIDRVVTPAEQEVLNRLRLKLGLDDRAYAQLQQRVERELVRSGALG
jgi:uncharacterized membrane protein YebE (DUF533 family)